MSVLIATKQGTYSVGRHFTTMPKEPITPPTPKPAEPQTPPITDPQPYKDPVELPPGDPQEDRPYRDPQTPELALTD